MSDAAGAERVRALEIGAGTGKATVAFATRGIVGRALEPDAAMAAIAERNCAGFPRVHFQRTSFEDWAVETYELLASQSNDRMLFEAQREELSAGVRRVLVDFGGTIAVPWSTLLVLGRRGEE